MKQINLDVHWTNSDHVDEMGYPTDSDESALMYLEALTQSSGSLVINTTGSLRELLYGSSYEFFPLDLPDDVLASGETPEPDPRGDAIIGYVYLQDVP